MHHLPQWAIGLAAIFAILAIVTGGALLGHYLHLLRRHQRRLRVATALRHPHEANFNTKQLLTDLLHCADNRLESLERQLTPTTLQILQKSDLPERLRRVVRWRGKWTRIRAILLLGWLRDAQAIGLLRTLAVDQDEEIALAAMAALARFDDMPTARFLLSLINVHQSVNLSRIASLIEGLRIDISEVLLERLQSDDTKSRFWAATLLGRYATDKVRAALVRSLSDSDPNSRAAILDSLAKIGDYTCEVSLVNALRDPVWYVRAHAALAIGRAQRSNAIEFLIDALADPVRWVRCDAAFAIEMLLKTQQAAKIERTLLASIDHPDTFARNQIAALLSNHGVVERLRSFDRQQGRRGDDARRLLTIIHRQGGAPQLNADRGWQHFLSGPSVVA